MGEDVGVGRGVPLRLGKEPPRVGRRGAEVGEGDAGVWEGATGVGKKAAVGKEEEGVLLAK